MAKEDTDEKLENAEIPGEDDERQEQQEKEAPKDVRGALRAAIKEESEKEDGESDKSDIPGSKDRVRQKKSAKPDNSKSEILESDEKNDASERSDKKEEKESSEREVSSKESKEEAKLEPVGHWKTKGKSTWDKLDKESQQEILNREQEVSQGFAQVSQRLKSLEEVEKVLAPRAQTIQQFGTTQAQVVDRLFQWMEALGHPNPAIKSQAFKTLAQNFGLNLDQLTPKQQENFEQAGNNNSNQDPNNPPQWFGEFTQQVQSEIGTLKQTLDSQKQAAADAFVANWAKDKKYYNDVRQLMGQLLSSGAVPMKGDQLDLDGAYETAIKIHPQVAAQVQQEMSEKAKADAKAKSDQEAKERAAKLASAKRAGSGLKPAAPFAPVNNSKSNGKSKPVSVRDSLKAALEEARE